MSYEVKLDVFEGPFDLLLHLIAKRRVDVAEVDLAEITADFLASLDGLEELDLETATRFLVVAATLVELKAARLLPAEQHDELDDLLGDARDLLYARLLEYRAFRDAAAVLSGLLDGNQGVLPREVALEPQLQRLVPDTALPIDARGLGALAAAATNPGPQPHVDLAHIRRAAMSIRDAVRRLLTALPAAGERATFDELTAGRSTSDRVVFFLALLELYKLGHLDLAQSDHRARLGVARREGGGALGAFMDEPDRDLPAAVPATAGSP